MRHLFNIIGRYMATDNTKHPAAVPMDQMFKGIHIAIEYKANDFRIAFLIRLRFMSAVCR